ncbi:zona pellucida protein AX 4 [Pygocentrus nattereri]|uniref:ZP domain-containing protein n=1 Tax=Pygocentrus nattereri TaxID=42514 RepID=A0A3B4EAK9_PYGNA|nr:zona pellucida protein AX 4 [Pygocentrus nattereri]
MCLTFPNVFLRMLLMSLPLSCSITVPAGTFTAKCHERHFWLSVKASFLGSAVQFNVEDSTGIHFLSSQRAAECGYTVVWNHHGDLVFRASYLACYVENRRDTEFRLQVWFVNRQSDGSVEAYPFKLHCSVTEPLSPREIVCEENYMEVSIQWYIPVEAEQFRMERVIFYRPGDAHPASQSVKEAEALGYHIVATDTRLLLRGAYSSPFFYMRKEQDIQMEAVDAIIVVQLEGASIPVEISMACTKNEAVVDGLHLLWSFPLAVSSLVHDLFRNGRIRMEVGGRMLSDCEMHESGYKATLKDLTMEIRIPSEANGAQIKSGVIKGQYVQSLSVELFYMHHWEDVIWLHTQHRSFRLLHTPYVPQTPTLINDTVSSTSMFSVTLGVFPADVSLQNITVGNDTMTWTKAQYQGLHLTQLLFTNGSHAYTLHVPFSHPLVTQKVISKHYRRHVLALTFDFFILPEEEHFSYSTDVVSDLKVPAVPARLEGRCTERGIVVLLHYGSEDVQWELYVGQRRIDWELVWLGGYKLKSEDDHLSVELPLYSPGMTYEDLSLKDLVAKVEVSALDVLTLKVQHSLVQRCTFPVRDLLACLPEGRMVVVADTTRSIPPVLPNSTTLLDSSCTPVATDSTRALFNFSLDSCGTTMTVEGNFLLYENQIRYMQTFLPKEDPLIHVDSPYRLTLQCRYPLNNTRTLTLHPLRNATIHRPSLPWKQT